MSELEEYSKTLPGVVAVETNMSYCTTSGAEVIKSNMKEHNCNRLVMAS
jgi:heterodisulfide reductase subunit A-like polyferredoxin